MTLLLVLVSLLGHDSFEVREQSHEVLSRMNLLLDLRPFFKSVSTNDPEIRARMGNITRNYETVPGYVPGIFSFTRNVYEFEDQDLDEVLFGHGILQSSWGSVYPVSLGEEAERQASYSFLQRKFDRGWSREKVMELVEKARRKEKESSGNTMEPIEEDK